MTAVASIIVPSYGRPDALRACLDALVQQTVPEVEIVIVDDGSPDNTAEVAAELIARYPDHRIELLRQENQGLAAARNAGIRATDSAFVLPLDADDQLEPGSVETLLRIFNDNPQIVAGLEDAYLQDDLYRLVLEDFRRRIEIHNLERQ